MPRMLTPSVRRRRVDGSADVDLRRQMADQLRAERRHLVVERRGVGDAQLVQRNLRIEPPGPARRQVIEHENVVSPGQQGVGDVGADETGTAGHKYAHT